MTEFRHDPNSLADRLDQVLPPGQPEQIGTDGDSLVETAARIASAPRPSLSPAAMARIQAQVTQAQPIPAKFPLRLPSPLRLGLVAAVSVLLVAGAVFAAHELGITLIAPTASSTPTPTSTEFPSLTASTAPTSTPTPTATNTPIASATNTQTETASPRSIPASATFTATAAVTATNEMTSTPPPVSIVIEGPVESINGSVVVIYDIEVQIDPNDPNLAIINVGDYVRIDGDQVVTGDGIIVIAVLVEVVNVDVEISPEGDVWRDSGDCSNPPPEWAPAHGWRARCEGAPRPGNSGGGGGGRDDDDDD